MRVINWHYEFDPFYICAFISNKHQARHRLSRFPMHLTFWWWRVEFLMAQTFSQQKAGAAMASHSCACFAIKWDCRCALQISADATNASIKRGSKVNTVPLSNSHVALNDCKRGMKSALFKMLVCGVTGTACTCKTRKLRCKVVRFLGSFVRSFVRSLVARFVAFRCGAVANENTGGEHAKPGHVEDCALCW